MSSQIEPSRSRPPLVRRAVAGLVLIGAAYLVVHVVIGVVLTIITIVAVLAVVVAVLWALNTIL